MKINLYRSKTLLATQLQLYVNPGENIVLPTTVMNTGNGPDRFDYRLTTVRPKYGIPVRAGHWDIVVPRDLTRIV